MRMLGITAHWTAAVRAIESKRKDRLFTDPLATALAGAEGMAWIEQRPSDSAIPTGIAIRTRDSSPRRGNEFGGDWKLPRF